MSQRDRYQAGCPRSTPWNGPRGERWHSTARAVRMGLCWPRSAADSSGPPVRPRRCWRRRPAGRGAGPQRWNTDVLAETAICHCRDRAMIRRDRRDRAFDALPAGRMAVAGRSGGRRVLRLGARRAHGRAAGQRAGRVGDGGSLTRPIRGGGGVLRRAVRLDDRASGPRHMSACPATWRRARPARLARGGRDDGAGAGRRRRRTGAPTSGSTTPMRPPRRPATSAAAPSWRPSRLRRSTQAGPASETPHGATFTVIQRHSDKAVADGQLVVINDLSLDGVMQAPGGADEDPRRRLRAWRLGVPHPTSGHGSSWAR